jgi:hypothetical protein
MHHKCKNCGTRWYGTIPKERRPVIRNFMEKYPWVTQHDLSRVLGVGDARLSEIMRKDPVRNGE